MQSIASHIESLSSNGLAESARLLSGFYLSASAKQPCKASPGRLRALASFADGLFETREYVRAVGFYQRAMDEHRSLAAESCPKDLSHCYLAHQLAKCLIHTGDHQQAMDKLLAIPSAERSVGVYMTMAKAAEALRFPDQAIAFYKEVLRACPAALEVLQSLANLGVPFEELRRLVLQIMVDDQQELEWIVVWVEGLCEHHKKDYKAAIQRFSALQTEFPRDPYVAAFLAHCEWKRGLLPQAKAAFEEARSIDEHAMDFVDTYAHVLVAQGAEVTLSTLCQKMLSTCRTRVETWLTLGRYCQLLCENSRNDTAARIHARRGLGFVEKAEEIDKGHPEVYMIKGTLLLGLDKAELATMAFRQAFDISRDFSAYQGLVSCYLASDRVTDALHTAKEAHESMRMNPRALTLLGVACARCEAGGEKARKAFTNALQADPECMDAVFALVEINVEEEKFDEAIKLLEINLHKSRTDYMYRRMGDVYMMKRDFDQALKHYELALGVNPGYEPAAEGRSKAISGLSGVPDPDEAEELSESDESLNMD
eukprot:m.220771 g.220771  ORF g.220771 m.220771 type:complete len:540 (-) comp22278_c0_seq4:30-1649(-)